MKIKFEINRYLLLAVLAVANVAAWGQATLGVDGYTVTEITQSPTGASSTRIQGTASAASAPVGNPVQIGGSDGSVMRAVKTDTSGNVVTVGNVANATADSGNPVAVAGVAGDGTPVFSVGARAKLQLSTRGDLRITPILPGATGADAFSNANIGYSWGSGSTTNLIPAAAAHLFNETSWDRQRGNTSVVVLASGARTTTQTGADQVNYNARGIKVFVNMTVVGTGSVTPSIQVKDANGIYYTVLTGTAIVTNTTQTLTIYPGATAAANVALSDVLPRNFRIVMTANNANSATYSAAYELIL